ncbi:MAG: anthranilate phosphoribosyltransferase [Candidatus Omnitrophica bacterium]|nr:anthranilate phosphoribosyltransferase [Candidatus Omnitrophota bacterium]
MITESLKKIINSQDLSLQETETVFTQIMQGNATPTQIAAFLTALHIKGETVDEITGAAAIMRKFAEPLDIKSKVIMDTCGTGGSGKHGFNVSTLTALVVSAAGVTVAKHGNRSITGKSGSADLLENLGVNINVEPRITEKCINEIGIGFMFAPLFHKAMKYAIGVRREIGFRTIFNILGPLTNPAHATHQLLGVFKADLCEPLARVLGKLGLKHALVVYGNDGLDEVTITDSTIVCEMKDGKIDNYTICPEQFGLKRALIEDVQISSIEESAKAALEILEGINGPMHDFVVINSACALYTAERVSSIFEGVELAKRMLREKKAAEKLVLLKKLTNADNT